MGRGEQCRRADAGFRHHAQLRVVARKRHRPLHDREPSARREDRVQVNPNWWNKPEHNLKEIIFTPIGSAATRVAALLSGEVDVIEPVSDPGYSRVNGGDKPPRS